MGPQTQARCVAVIDLCFLPPFYICAFALQFRHGFAKWYGQTVDSCARNPPRILTRPLHQNVALESPNEGLATLGPDGIKKVLLLVLQPRTCRRTCRHWSARHMSLIPGTPHPSSLACCPAWKAHMTTPAYLGDVQAARRVCHLKPAAHCAGITTRRPRVREANRRGLVQPRVVRCHAQIHDKRINVNVTVRHDARVHVPRASVTKATGLPEFTGMGHGHAGGCRYAGRCILTQAVVLSRNNLHEHTEKSAVRCQIV